MRRARVEGGLVIRPRPPLPQPTGRKLRRRSRTRPWPVRRRLPPIALRPRVRERGGLDAGRKGLTRRAQRLGQPARADQEVFGGLGHLRLLEGADALRRRVALGFTERFQDAALGDPAEIVVDRRPPADRRHVEGDGLGDPIGMGDRLRAAIVGLGHGVEVSATQCANRPWRLSWSNAVSTSHSAPGSLGSCAAQAACRASIAFAEGVSASPGACPPKMALFGSISRQESSA